MNPLELLWIMFKASLLSFSGIGNVPALHDDLVARGWVTERRFAEALAIGQTAPGPSGLWAVSLGYLIDGLRGALAAALAITLPPLLVLVVARVYRLIQHHPLVQGFVRGLGLAFVGSFVVVMLKVLRDNGVDGTSVLIAGAAMVLGLDGRVPVIGIIAGSAAIGVFVYG